MPTVTIEEAQNKLGELIRALNPGQEVVITENNLPVARLLPTDPAPPKQLRQFGTLRGTVLSIEHFDEPLGDFEEYM